jgi:hypothetical protein
MKIWLFATKWPYLRNRRSDRSTREFHNLDKTLNVLKTVPGAFSVKMHFHLAFISLTRRTCTWHSNTFPIEAPLIPFNVNGIKTTRVWFLREQKHTSDGLWHRKPPRPQAMGLWPRKPPRPQVEGVSRPKRDSAIWHWSNRGHMLFIWYFYTTPDTTARSAESTGQIVLVCLRNISRWW